MSQSNDQLIKNFKAGKAHGKSSRMFFEGDTLYSFGRHFPLLVKRPFGYLLNADKYSRTTSSHQRQCSSTATIQIPFSALQSAGIDYRQFSLIDKSVQRYDKTGKYVKYTSQKITTQHSAFGRSRYIHKIEKISTKEYNLLADKTDWSEEEERRPEACVIEYAGTHYLSSMDGQNYFICELPEKVKTVDDAFESLKPKGLLGREYIRQGEWFFVISSDFNPIRKIIYKNMNQKFILPKTNPRSNSHTATRGYCTNSGSVLVSGRVRHREHRTTVLSKLPDIKIYEALENRAVHSWSASGKVD
jgi:hypothetical protein